MYKIPILILFFYFFLFPNVCVGQEPNEDSIFLGPFEDIDKAVFVDDGFTSQDGVFMPSKDYEGKGRIAGYVEILGWDNLTKFGNHLYIAGEPVKSVIYVTGSKKYSPSMWFWWNCGVDDIKESVRTEEKDGVLTVYLDVDMKWHRSSYNSMTHNRRKTYFYESETFSDSVIIPPAYPYELPGVCQIKSYSGINNHSVIIFTPPNGSIKTTFNYKNESVVKYCMIGTVDRTERSNEYANFEKWDYWKVPEGQRNLTRRGSNVYISGDFEPELFSIDVGYPYIKKPVTDYEITDIYIGFNEGWYAVLLFLVVVFFVLSIIYAVLKYSIFL